MRADDFTESFQLPGDNGAMYVRLRQSYRSIPVILGVAALTDVLLLFAWDIFPKSFPARSHDLLAAFSLATIAVAYLIYEVAHRPSIPDLVKTTLLALAFLFWAANQLWPSLPQAVLFNDVAVGLFVLDVFLVMVGWPPTIADTSFAETCSGDVPGRRCCAGPTPQSSNPQADGSDSRPHQRMPVEPVCPVQDGRHQAEYLAQQLGASIMPWELEKKR